MNFETKITRIGDSALKIEDQMVVIFGQNVTDDISEVSLSQEFTEPEKQSEFTLKEGGVVTIGDNRYPITYVGHLVEDNMRTIGHVNLIFSDPADHLASAVYLDGSMDPKDFKLGSIISYGNK